MTHILNSPKLKGHPVYSKPYLRLSYSQYLYRRTLSLAQYCCLSRVFCRFFQICSSPISRKEEKSALGADSLFSEEQTPSFENENSHHPTVAFTVTGVSGSWGQFNSTSQGVNFNLLSWLISIVSFPIPFPFLSPFSELSSLPTPCLDVLGHCGLQHQADGDFSGPCHTFVIVSHLTVL